MARQGRMADASPRRPAAAAAPAAELDGTRAAPVEHERAGWEAGAEAEQVLARKQSSGAAVARPRSSSLSVGAGREREEEEEEEEEGEEEERSNRAPLKKRRGGGERGDATDGDGDGSRRALRDESSADETTGIVASGGAGGRRGYQSTSTNAGSTTGVDLGGAAAARSGAREGDGRAVEARRRKTRREGEEREEQAHGWLRRLLDSYGSVELENKGSVARDHLALERTFLAWLRTSLSFASIGIAVTQLFRLNTAAASGANAHLRSLGKPLGATFVGVAVVVLLVGFHRYFESQHYIVRGRFPAGRGSVLLVALVTGALIVASLTVVLVVGQASFEN